MLFLFIVGEEELELVEGPADLFLVEPIIPLAPDPG